jgi:hypothetical protein
VVVALVDLGRGGGVMDKSKGDALLHLQRKGSNWGGRRPSAVAPCPPSARGNHRADAGEAGEGGSSRPAPCTPCLGSAHRFKSYDRA